MKWTRISNKQPFTLHFSEDDEVKISEISADLRGSQKISVQMVH